MQGVSSLVPLNKKQLSMVDYGGGLVKSSRSLKKEAALWSATAADTSL